MLDLVSQMENMLHYVIHMCRSYLRSFKWWTYFAIWDTSRSLIYQMV